MQRDEAAEIFRSLREGKLTIEKEAKLESWYNARVGTDNGYDGIPESLGRIDRYVTKMLNKSRTNPVLKLPWLYAAASVMLAGLLYLLWPMLLRQEISVSAGAGETKNVRLPDGSNVELNAGSTLRYPEKFQDDERVVRLEGEGYFKVRSLKPEAGRKKQGVNFSTFIVKTRHQEVTVLGTEFNVKAFAADSVERVSLVAGKVKVSTSPDTLILEPGQQSVYTDGKLEVASMQPGTATAWKEGFFDFFYKPATEVLHELSRWYGFELVNAEHIPDKKLVGRIPKTLKFSMVLTLLKDAGIHFRMEGDKRMIIL